MANRVPLNDAQFHGPRLSPAQALACARSGWSLSQSGALDQALALLEDAVTCLPSDRDVVSAYAFTLAKALRTKEAHYWLQRAAELSPDNIEVQVAAGEIACEVQDYAGAAQRFARCLQLDPSGREPAGIRARALIKRTEKQLASRRG
jgi:Flp pilus assembly protein TadD